MNEIIAVVVFQCVGDIYQEPRVGEGGRRGNGRVSQGFTRWSLVLLFSLHSLFNVPRNTPRHYGPSDPTCNGLGNVGVATSITINFGSHESISLGTPGIARFWYYSGGPQRSK